MEPGLPAQTLQGLARLFFCPIDQKDGYCEHLKSLYRGPARSDIWFPFYFPFWFLFCVKSSDDDEYWQRTLEHKAKAVHGSRPLIGPSQALLRNYPVESHAQDVDSTLACLTATLLFSLGHVLHSYS